MRVSIYGDGPTLGSGYGKVAYYLGKELIKRGFKVSWLSLQYGTGRPIPFEDGEIWPGDPMSLDASLRETKPDILLHIRDNWVFTRDFYNSPYSFTRYWDTLKFKQINYTPVQCVPLPQSFVQSVTTEAHLTLITSRWGSDWLRSAGVPSDRVDYLYNGVDQSIYKKSDDEVPDFPKRFMFVGANYDYRKNIPTLLKAFKMYLSAADDPDAQLYIHANLIGHYSLPAFISALGLDKKNVLFKSNQSVKNFGYGVDEASLVALYNWANVYVTPTISEGFNMPALEAEMIGLPVVLTDFPVHRELFNRFDRTYFVPAVQDYATVWGFEWFSRTDDLLRKMTLAKPGRVERDSSKFTEFLWSNIADRFIRLIGENLGL